MRSVEFEESIHILHIDDNENDLYLFKRKLIELDHSLVIDWVNSAEEALEKLESGKWDCLLVDYEMPGGMNGLELLKVLRDQGNAIPFIYLTGQGNEQIATEAFRFGASDYFTKNFDFAYFHRIVNSIRQHVRSYHKAEEQREAEKLMRELNFERERILSNVNDVIWSAELDDNHRMSRFIYMSPAMGKITGYSNTEFYDNPNLLPSIIHPDDLPEFIEVDKNVAKGKSSITEFRLKKKDEKYLWVRVKIFPEVDKNGEIHRMHGISSDINAQKEAEIARKASEQNYQSLFNIVPLMIIISTAKEGIFREVNDAVSSLTGYTKDEMIGKSSLELGIWADPSERGMVVDEILRKGYAKGLKMHLQLKNGQKVDVMADAIPITYNNEKCFMMIVSSLQMKDDKIDEYRRSEDRYRFLLMNTKEPVLVVDDTGKIFDANPSAAKMLMYDRLDLVNKNVSEIIPSSQAEIVKTIFNNLSKNPAKISFKRKDEKIIESTVKKSTYNAQGISFMQMIIDGHQDEEISDLESTKSIYETLLDEILGNSPDIVYIKDSSGKLKAANEKFAKMMNVAKDDITKKSPEEFLPSNINSKFQQSFRKRDNPDNPIFFIVNLGEKSEEHTYHFVEFPIQKKHGDETLWCGIGREMTDFQKPDEKIRRINAELDEFVNKVSHDLKAPIRNVIGYIEMALEKGDMEGEYIKKAMDQCAKLQIFISKLLELSKAGRVIGNFQKFDSNLLVLEVFDLFKNQHTDIELLLEGEFPELYADRTAILEVFQNLIMNAIEHSDKSKSSSFVKVYSKNEENEIVFTVEDNGMGMSKQLLDGILLLDYNLNQTGFHILGFGLPISRKIINAHGGRLWIESIPGEGSRFHFSIPKNI